MWFSMGSEAPDPSVCRMHMAPRVGSMHTTQGIYPHESAAPTHLGTFKQPGLRCVCIQRHQDLRLSEPPSLYWNTPPSSPRPSNLGHLGDVTQIVLRALGTWRGPPGGGSAQSLNPQRGIGSKKHALPFPEMEKGQRQPHRGPESLVSPWLSKSIKKMLKPTEIFN